MASPVASPTLRFSADASPPSYFPPTSLSVSTLDSKMIQGNSSPPSTATFPPRQGGAKAGALAPYGPGEWQPITRQKTKGTYTSDLLLNSSAAHLVRFFQTEALRPCRSTFSVSTSGPQVIKDSGDFAFTIAFAPVVEDSEHPLLSVAGNWEIACRGGPSAFWTADGDGRCQAPVLEEGGRGGGIVAGGGGAGYEALPTTSGDDSEEQRRPEPRRAVGHDLEVILSEEWKQRRQVGSPDFIHPASLVEMSGSTKSPYPELLFQGQLVDFSDVHRPGTEILNSTRDVSDAVEAYLADTNPFKELSLTKEMYGYAWIELVEGITQTVQDGESGYKQIVTVVHQFSSPLVRVRPPNVFTTIFELHGFFRFLLSLVLIYPVLCVFRGIFGTKHDQFRSSIPLTRWLLLPPPSHSATHTVSSAVSLAESLTSRRPAKVGQLPAAPGEEGLWVYLVGEQEGEWLRRWGKSIASAAERRVQRGEELPLKLGEEELSSRLRGYGDAREV